MNILDWVEGQCMDSFRKPWPNPERELKVFIENDNDWMTPQKCIDICYEQGFAFAGLGLGPSDLIWTEKPIHLSILREPNRPKMTFGDLVESSERIFISMLLWKSTSTSQSRSRTVWSCLSRWCKSVGFSRWCLLLLAAAFTVAWESNIGIE